MSTQAWAAKPILMGQVYLIGEHDEETPADNVVVKLKGRGDPTVTLSQGEFELSLPTITRDGQERPLYGPGETIKLIVEKPAWIINSPVDGETRLPSDLLKDSVEIRLLPVGSHKLWSHERFQKEMRALQEKTKKQILPQTDTPQDITFDQHIAHIADKLGFSPKEVKARMDQWAKESETAEDPYDKALAEYYNKNFIQAKKLFQQSADLKLQELALIQQKEEALQKRKLQVIEEAVGRLKGKGDSAYSAYQFEEALEAYEQALAILPNEQLDLLRADVQMDIAGANWAIGIRTEGQKVHAHLNKAKQVYQEAEEKYGELGQQEGRARAQVGLGSTLSQQGIRLGGKEGQQCLAESMKAFRQALTIYTREEFPQDWAATQNNLGNALTEQGIRLSGTEGHHHLAKAEEAFRQALMIYTREEFSQNWAATQNNLGNVYRAQGSRHQGKEGGNLMVKAITAFEQALKVRTVENNPQAWVQTQVALARTAKDIGNWEQAVESYKKIMLLYPDFAEAYNNLYVIFHDKIFAYNEALALTSQWLTSHPTDLVAQTNFAEAEFTAGQFAKANQHIVNLLEKSKVDSSTQIALRLLKIAALSAQEKIHEVPSELGTVGAILRQQPEAFALEWEFAGTKHFILQNIRFNSSRDLLLPLFEGFEEKKLPNMKVAVTNAQTFFISATPKMEQP
ncbi:MAG: hypothetical protein KC588_04930 [Nitrospira sp.]|nr:hypothetical protein [Nitrospira sp.]